MNEPQLSKKIPIVTERDVVVARVEAKKMAQTMGFSSSDATQIAVVVSELGRNIIHYAGEGSVTLIPKARERSFKVVAQDHGPGIPDIKLALTPGYSTAQGLGRGLSGSKALMDEFGIESVVGAGTMVTAVKYLY
jgi:serine/threonine-protein kinase RsbT